MVKNFKNYISKKNLFATNDKVLLAVSGGMDSVLLCHLFKASGFQFGMAHCNFQLRGEASDGDAAFVKSLAQQLDVPFFETTFDTQKYVDDNKLSIQVAARYLRYEWLEKIRLENDFQYLATAHHIDDSIETVLYNFTKGCGIRGLHGILPKKNTIIRPLLFTDKKEIKEYVEMHQIEYREDASNATDKYSRNNIRHHVIPILEKINSAFQKTGSENIERLRDTELLFDFAIDFLKKEICEAKDNQIFIHLNKLKNAPAPSTVLFEILNPYGFNNAQVQQIMSSLTHQSGAIFLSPTHELLLDRAFLILKNNSYNNTITNQEFLISRNDTHLDFPKGKLLFEINNNTPTFFAKEKNIAFFDLKKLKFPLTLRKWKAGDAFYPFGMNGQRKKVKDLLTNLKLNRFEKDETYVLESDGQICWVVGIRLDERFKIEDSDSILKIRFEDLRDSL